MPRYSSSHPLGSRVVFYDIIWFAEAASIYGVLLEVAGELQLESQQYALPMSGEGVIEWEFRDPSPLMEGIISALPRSVSFWLEWFQQRNAIQEVTGYLLQQNTYAQSILFEIEALEAGEADERAALNAELIAYIIAIQSLAVTAYEYVTALVADMNDKAEEFVSIYEGHTEYTGSSWEGAARGMSVIYTDGENAELYSDSHEIDSFIAEGESGEGLWRAIRDSGLIGPPRARKPRLRRSRNRKRPEGFTSLSGVVGSPIRLDAGNTLEDRHRAQAAQHREKVSALRSRTVSAERADR